MKGYFEEGLQAFRENKKGKSVAILEEVVRQRRGVVEDDDEQIFEAEECLAWV